MKGRRERALGGKNNTGKTLEEKEQMLLSMWSNILFRERKVIPPEPLQCVVLKKYINFRCKNIFLVYE